MKFSVIKLMIFVLSIPLKRITVIIWSKLNKTPFSTAQLEDHSNQAKIKFNRIDRSVYFAKNVHLNKSQHRSNTNFMESQPKAIIIGLKIMNGVAAKVSDHDLNSKPANFNYFSR